MSLLFDKWEKQKVTFPSDKPIKTNNAAPKDNIIEIQPVQMQRREKPIPEKEMVLSFMRKAKVVSVAPMMYRDKETGERAIEAYCQQAGKYGWTSETLYHFERYNYPLPEDFIEYIRRNASRSQD